ncbi:hypothetical protein [Oceaniglobus roseus]|uniref:hypothetical protein n=1 Tax=Oceaniglobus roseus TaxID=1737570 RepID=UPI000C7ED5D7|nr:hypothetical protein [Kandeliimicrobium roseum]
MSGGLTADWLWRAYCTGLVLHGLLILFFAFAALALGGFVYRTPNAASQDLGFALLSMVPALLPALPSALALASWRILHRRGERAGPGHQALVAAGAVTIPALILLTAALTA